MSKRLGDWSQKAPEWVQPFKEGLSGELLDSHDVVVERPVVEPEEEIPNDVRVSAEEESADLSVFAARSTRPGTSRPIGSHNVFDTFSQTFEL